jgi:hypothetical protein
MLSVLFAIIIDAAAASQPLENLSSTELHQTSKPAETIIPLTRINMTIESAQNVILNVMANVLRVPL